jgi:gamma-glutamyl-gamma-aminobutyrate hydrolase PuuD
VIAGYAQYGPGLGPFKALFNKGVNLTEVDSLDGLDAIILWGGADISPSLYDEKPYKFSGPPQPSERDVFEWECMRLAVAASIPIIGVCRGAQLMCAFAGGKLIQDVEGHGNGYHQVKTIDGQEFTTSTCHHQMMYPYDIEHELLAWTPEHRSCQYNPTHTQHSAELDKRLVKEPEVVYFPTINGLGVQGHPEWHTTGNPMQFNTWLIGMIRDKCFSKQKMEC